MTVTLGHCMYLPFRFPVFLVIFSEEPPNQSTYYSIEKEYGLKTGLKTNFVCPILTLDRTALCAWSHK